MTEEQLETITNNLSAKLVETVKTTVNGKIDALHTKVDAHNQRHEADMEEVRKHMEDVKPIVQEYQEKETVKKVAKETGDQVKYVASVIASVGALITLTVAAIKGIIPFK